ncbi:hypothetical protein O53_2685 [Microcystis aeruginosa TAIHU98]|uniref:Uncharacterized protein n=1 Tax=Microcystis aeruginosa TAIHU98 TaxID=1134457 RepID=L7E4A6_MICAE|nr:hypothetical protein O53_2685 [Microcystis aeruginosa TAIHU98]
MINSIYSSISFLYSSGKNRQSFPWGSMPDSFFCLLPSEADH